MYGEDTILFSRRVPKSKEDEIEKLVDTFLAPFLIKRKMKKKLDPVADPEKTFFREGSILSLSEDGIYNKNVDLPPVKAIAPTPLIKDSKTGAITYPCGCFDDGNFHKAKSCQLGDQSDHVVYYWDEK